MEGRAFSGLRVWAKQHYSRAVSCWGSMGGSEVNQDNEEGRGRHRVELTDGEP